MKKIMQKFLLLIICSLAFFKVSSYTGKTFLLPQPLGMPQHLELSNPRKCLDCSKVHKTDGIAATFFYGEALNHRQLGGYFGVAEKNVMRIGSHSDDASLSDLYYRQIVHDNGDVAAGQKVNMTLLPYHEQYGFVLSQRYFLNRNIFIAYAVPVIKVSNKVQTSFDTVNMNEENLGKLKKFFSGDVINEGAAAGNLQSQLTFAKIDNKCHTSFGFSDAEVAVGYQWNMKNDVSCVVQGSLSLPLGNKPSAEFLFGPVRGNGKHVGLGVGVKSFGRLTGNESSGFDFLMQANGQYLIRNAQTRTLGLKDINWSHYYLLGKKSTEADQPLIPAANILTHDVWSYPGWNYQGTGEVSFHASKFIVGVGYQVFMKEHEQLKLKNGFQENQYGLANKDFATTVHFDQPAGNFMHNIGDRCWIMERDLDKEVAQQQSMVNHTLFAHGGVVLKKILTDIGVAYTYTRENSSVEAFSGWLKAGYVF